MKIFTELFTLLIGHFLGSHILERTKKCELFQLILIVSNEFIVFDWFPVFTNKKSTASFSNQRTVDHCLRQLFFGTKPRQFCGKKNIALTKEKVGNDYRDSLASTSIAKIGFIECNYVLKSTSDILNVKLISLLETMKNLHYKIWADQILKVREIAKAII